MNCKPGIRAQIIRAPVDPQHLGKIVTVISAGRPSRLRGAPTWKCSPPLYREGMPHIDIAWCDDHLHAIDGGESPEESIEAMRLLIHIPSEVTT